MDWQTSVVEFLKENATPDNILIVVVTILIVVVILHMWWTTQQRKATINELQPHPVSRIQKLWDELSDREKQVARLVADGKSNAEVAEELGIAQNTVKSHLHGLYKHFKISSRTDLTYIVRHVVG